MENRRLLGRSWAARSSRRGAGVASWLGVCALVASVACSQADPDEPMGGAELQSYFPLVAGSWWDYRHSDWTERVSVTAADFNGSPAFRMSDEANPTDLPEDQVRSDSTITSVDGRAVRVLKDEYQVRQDGSEELISSVSYGAGFTRFNDDWANQAVGYRETPEYERVETRPDGTVLAPEARRHTFEIVSLASDVDTPRGTFSCIVIQRTKDWETDDGEVDADDAETKLYWFARGVGKVQETNPESGKSETLVDFMIPSE